MKELKVRISMPISGLITEANRKEFSEKSLEGFKVKAVERITMDPMLEELMWEEEHDGFMPKSKADRAKRLAMKKVNDHEKWRLKELDKEMHNLFATDYCAYRCGFSYYRKELEPIWRSGLKEMDKPFVQTRQKSGKQTLTDYYESVAADRAKAEAVEDEMAKTLETFKEVQSFAKWAENKELFYRTKAEQAHDLIAELEEKLAMLEGFVD